MFKVIIIFLFSTSFLYGGFEVSGGYNSSSRFVDCDNGEKIGASKTQCSAEGNRLQLQPHINIKIYSNKYLYVGVKTGVMIGSPLTGYFISSNIIF